MKKVLSSAFAVIALSSFLSLAYANDADCQKHTIKGPMSVQISKDK